MRLIQALIRIVNRSELHPWYEGGALDFDLLCNLFYLQRFVLYENELKQDDKLLY